MRKTYAVIVWHIADGWFTIGCSLFKLSLWCYNRSGWLEHYADEVYHNRRNKKPSTNAQIWGMDE